MSKDAWVRLLAFGLLVGLALPRVSDAIKLPVFPGALDSARAGTEAGIAQAVSIQTKAGDVSFRVTSVLSDPEQTVIAYQVQTTANVGAFITIAPRPRLILPDGGLVPFIANAQRGEEGSLVFSGVPRGEYELRLELDGVDLASGPIRQVISLAVPVDNIQAYDSSERRSVNFRAGQGKTSVTISEISRTPSLIVIRGFFDGLSVEEIQQLGRPDFWLTGPDGSVLTESGRFGFGEDYRSFEFRFPAISPGPATLELRGFYRGNAEAVREFLESNPNVELTIP